MTPQAVRRRTSWTQAHLNDLPPSNDDEAYTRINPDGTVSHKRSARQLSTTKPPMGTQSVNEVLLKHSHRNRQMDSPWRQRCALRLSARFLSVMCNAGQMADVGRAIDRD